MLTAVEFEYLGKEINRSRDGIDIPEKPPPLSFRQIIKMTTTGIADIRPGDNSAFGNV
jgi:hypothetical protein